MKEGEYGKCIFVFVYENETMTPVELFQEEGRGDEGEAGRG